LANKLAIEQDISSAYLNKQLLDESQNNILSSMDQIISQIADVEQKENLFLNEREDLETQCNNLKNMYAEELGHYIEEKNLIKSIYDIDEDKMKLSKSIDQTTESINNNQSEINRLSNKIASNRQMIKDTTDKIKNISESFLAADHIEKELDERIIQPY